MGNLPVLLRVEGRHQPLLHLQPRVARRQAAVTLISGYGDDSAFASMKLYFKQLLDYMRWQPGRHGPD
ncbi:hypothetical protein ACLOA0_04755 [Limosilactobacillus fermentum]|uniref:hypothetical protein n=1 Tax=Limosilactobacillus fermentum TaxID=1613 RepID=UPI000A8C7D70